MPANRPDAPRQWRSGAGVLCLLLLVTACSTRTLDGIPPTVDPARAAQSPPVTRTPAGVTRQLDGHPLSAVFDARTRQLAVLVAGRTETAPSSVALIGAQQTSPRKIPLPGAATGISGDNAGFAYLSTRGGYLVVDLSSGKVTRVSVRDAEHADFSAITHRADGTAVLGTSDGALYALRPGAVDATRTAVHAHVDSLAAQGNTVAVLDRGQTSVSTVEADGRVGQSLRAGMGATTLVADPAGRLLVTDTRGGQLLVYGVDPLILRQAYPVADSPYGVTGSRGLAWVSQTSANTVVGYDLSTGIPLEKVRYPSVRQPNALAFDDATDTLFVISGSGDGVQIVQHASTGAR